MDNPENLPAKKAVNKTVQFEGYSFEELKYQRALYALRKEFAKEQVLQTFNMMRPKKDDQNSGSGFLSKFGLMRSVGSKVFKSLNALDYVMLGMSAFGTAKKAISLFKKKK